MVWRAVAATRKTRFTNIWAEGRAKEAPIQDFRDDGARVAFANRPAIQTKRVPFRFSCISTIVSVTRSRV